MTCKLCAWVCAKCKPENDGPEIGWVPDVEHASDGKTPLTGFALFKSRVLEGFIGEPICWAARKLARCKYK